MVYRYRRAQWDDEALTRTDEPPIASATGTPLKRSIQRSLTGIAPVAVPSTTLAEGITIIPSPTERMNIHRDVEPDLRPEKRKADEKGIDSGKVGLDIPSVL